jgi:hypothetical protein
MRKAAGHDRDFARGSLRMSSKRGGELNEDQALEVDRWIAAIRECDEDEIERIASSIPPELWRTVIERGGPVVRERVFIPVMERMERKGVIEWTGEYAANGQTLYRSLIYEGDEGRE